MMSLQLSVTDSANNFNFSSRLRLSAESGNCANPTVKYKTGAMK